MLRMDQVHVIRHKVLVEGQSVRPVARQIEVSRNTVRKYLRVSAPVRVERQPHRQLVEEGFHVASGKPSRESAACLAFSRESQTRLTFRTCRTT